MKKLIIVAIAAIFMLTACEEGMNYKSHNAGYYPYLEFSVDHDTKKTYVTIVEEVEDAIIPVTYNGYPTKLLGVLDASVKGPEVSESIKNSIKSISLGKEYFNSMYGDPSISHWENLEHINLLDGVELIRNQFFMSWNHLKSFTMSDSVKKIGNAVFSFCSSLEKVTIGNGLKNITMAAFSNCYSLKEVTFGNNVEVIDMSAFSDCYSLTRIELPESLKLIAGAAFYNCKSLEEIVIPNSVTRIELGAFVNCDSLKSISLPAGTYNLEHILGKTSGQWSVNGEIIQDFTNFVATDRKLLTRE